MKFLRTVSLAGVAALLAASAAFAAEKPFLGQGGVGLDVPYVPTPPQVVERMLKIANTGPNDIHYDLGCGDGRIVISAAKDFKVKKAVGVDLDPERIAEANANAKTSGVTDRVQFIQGDLFALDFKDVTVLTLYLLPDINLKLRPIILDQLKPGTRVVSHAFTMGNWNPDQHDVVDGRHIYFWTVPAKVAGAWQWQVGSTTYRVDLTQQIQNVSGKIRVGDSQSDLEKPVLNGDALTFTARPMGGQPVRFEGKIAGDTIVATVDVGGQSARVTARRVEPQP